MKHSIRCLEIHLTLPVVVMGKLQALGSRVDTQDEGFHVDTFFPSLAPYSFNLNSPRPPTWKVDITMAHLEYVKVIEQPLACPIQDMIVRRAETINRMLMEWRTLIPPPHTGY